VVEHYAEAVLMACLLDATRGIAPRFFVSEEQTGLATLARNILVHEGGPVLVVMNSQTSDEKEAAEKKGFVDAAIRYVANDDAFGVVAFTPSIEIIAFEKPSVLMRYVGGTGAAESLLALGALDPSGTLHRVQGGSEAVEQFYRSLSTEELRTLSEGAQATDLLAEVDRLTGVVTAAVQAA
jgi:hypothetical protein